MTAATATVICIGMVCATLIALALIGSNSNKKQKQASDKITEAILNNINKKL